MYRKFRPELCPIGTSGPSTGSSDWDLSVDSQSVVPVQLPEVPTRVVFHCFSVSSSIHSILSVLLIDTFSVTDAEGEADSEAHPGELG